jgi:hypothetical protein
MIRHVFKVEGRTLTEDDIDALLKENIPICSSTWDNPHNKAGALDIIADAINLGTYITLDGKPVTRENA